MVRMRRSGPGDRFRRAAATFRTHGGILTTAGAIRAGIHPATLYALRNNGSLDRLSRGLYRLADGRGLSNPDLVTVALKVPKGILCLISALSFHELTTQVPHEVQIALPRGAESPRLGHPPVRVFRLTGKALTEGVETHEVDGIPVRVYSVEKTLADCFKFRNRIGVDVAVEALRLYRERKKVDVGALLRCAAICRVENVMRPYLEAVL
jgi:predicted transcriptional regulator of viral defense system